MKFGHHREPSVGAGGQMVPAGRGGAMRMLRAITRYQNGAPILSA
jgi:hypothetical protein